MGARRIVASGRIDAPLDRLWDLLCDTGRYAEWVEGTVEVVRTDGEARLGSTYDERNKFLGPWKARSRWRVTEFERPRRMVHVAERFPLVSGLHVDWELAPAAHGGTDAVFGVEYTPALGPLGTLLDRWMVRGVRADHERTLENLRALAGHGG